MQVQGSTALVTGGNRGPGLAFAEELRARGAARVYVGVRRPDGFDRPGSRPLLWTSPTSARSGLQPTDAVTSPYW